MNFEDPQDRTRTYEKWQAYGQAQTAYALFVVGFDQRFKIQGVRANSVMPGGIMTPLQRHLPMAEQIAMGWIDENGKVREGFKTPEPGASTSVWAAIGKGLEGTGGLYLENCAHAVARSKIRDFRVSCRTRSTQSRLTNSGPSRSRRRAQGRLTRVSEAWQRRPPGSPQAFSC